MRKISKKEAEFKEKMFKWNKIKPELELIYFNLSDAKKLRQFGKFCVSNGLYKQELCIYKFFNSTVFQSMYVHKRTIKNGNIIKRLYKEFIDASSRQENDMAV